MKKITKIMNYGTKKGLQQMQAQLSTQEREMLDGENHAICFVDGSSMEANGVASIEKEKSNYRYFLKIGSALEYQGVKSVVTGLQFPHIMLDGNRDKKVLHVVKYVASKLRELL